MTPELVFSGDRREYLADLFEKDITPNGFLRDRETGEIVTDKTGRRIEVDDIGIISSETDDVVRDDVGDILAYTTDVEN